MDTVDILACGNQRYHLTLGHRRTTVSLDNHLSLLLSLKLGHTPQTPQAQRAVRHWLQARLDESGDYNRLRISQWLAEAVMRTLLSDEVTTLYNHWLDQLLEQPRVTPHTQINALAAAPKNG
jgi:hypothetical protein